MERVTAGADPSQPLPMIVAIHGLGDSPEGFGALFQDLPFRARIILPAGPLPEGTGHSWFPVRVRDRDPAALAAGIGAALPGLIARIEDLRKERPTTGKVVVTGFSQGGILSFALVSARPDLFAGAMPIGGLLPPQLHPTRAGEPRIFALHGEVDGVVPFAGAKETVAAFVAKGYRAELRGWPEVGHQVTPPMRAALYDGLRSLTSTGAEALRPWN